MKQLPCCDEQAMLKTHAESLFSLVFFVRCEFGFSVSFESEDILKILYQNSLSSESGMSSESQ